MGCKIFPCIDIRGGQARLRWTRHRLLHSYRPLDSFEVPRRLIQMSSGIEVRLAAYGIFTLVPPSTCVESTGSLEPSTSLYVNKFISFWEHPYLSIYLYIYFENTLIYLSIYIYIYIYSKVEMNSTNSDIWIHWARNSINFEWCILMGMIHIFQW